MRSYFFLFLLMGCGPQSFRQHGDRIDVTPTEGASDSMLAPQLDDECACLYSQPEDVHLVFSRRAASDELFEVHFVVKEKSGVEFESTARVRKDCAEDFEKKGRVSGSLERRLSGTCSPISIRPRNYSYECWN